MTKKYKEEEVAKLIYQARQEAAREAQTIGFELGIEAQKEYYRLSEKPVSKEAEHILRCPSCESEIHIPCVNYTLAQTRKELA